MKTYAFAHENNLDRVVAWCEKVDDGYWVINGQWTIENPREYGAVLVWEGEVPKHISNSHHDRSYNEAINWIEEQLNEDHQHQSDSSRDRGQA